MEYLNKLLSQHLEQLWEHYFNVIMRQCKMKILKYILLVLFIPISLKASGLWPIIFSDNSKINIFAPFIQSNDNKTIFRPLWIYEKKDNDYRFQFLYPIIDFTKNNKRIFPIYNNRVTQKKHTNLFPFFWGKNEKGEKYWGFFPFYGKLLDRLQYDEIKFILWPFWTEKAKNKKKEYSFLWPFFGWGEKSFRFWPFFSIKDGEEKYFFWPFFIFQKRKIGPKQDDYEHKHIYFPIYIHTYSNDYNYKTFIFPFFRYNKHKSGYRHYAFPWPILSYEKEDSSGKYFKFNFFPLYRKIYLKNYQKQSFFWILFINETTFIKTKKYTTKKSFLMINRFEKNYFDDTTYKNIWPFFEYSSSKNSYILKIFELFPFKLKPVYELYSPFFNIFYIIKKNNYKKLNFLWGLFVYEKDDKMTTIKLFQFLKLKFNHEKKINFSKNNIDFYFVGL